MLIVPSQVHAQLYQTQYRAPGQNWMEIRSDRFRVIYPERYEQEAIRSMHILESDYRDIQKQVGGSLRNFPAIINPENDRSNGFVSPLNFRTEIELAPIIGKTMNPRSGDWLELVLPHELVHALHFSVNPSSFTSAIGLFSPDLRRSVHAAAPLGVFEGIAVHHESHGTIDGSGRGNHPYFKNQFHTTIGSNEQWSMGQLLHTTDFTPPFDRHYIGGYELTHWLFNRYGEDVIRKTIDFHYRYPFLGYGVALRKTTGEWPNRLYAEFKQTTESAEEERREAITGKGVTAVEEVIFRANCKRLNRPLWTDENQVLFYARSCNRSPGFYQYDIQDGSTNQISEVVIASDYHVSLTSDRNALYFSRLHTDKLYDNLFRGDLHRLDLKSGRSERLTRQARLFSPERINGELYARQVDANELNLVKVDPESGEVLVTYSKPEESSVVQIAGNPHREGHAAVIGRRKSVQAVWLTDLRKAISVMNDEPVIVFREGSVYDLSWHPAEEKFLFTSDHTGVMNIYEYDLEANEVVQLTESLFNAFEGSYSPDGGRIAFIGQEGTEQKLFLMNRAEAVERLVPKWEWVYSDDIDQMFARPLMNRDQEEFDDLEEWEFERYRTGMGWLKPRYWTPVYEQFVGRDRFGLNFQSVDVMSSQRYDMEFSYYADRAWYRAEYVNKQFFPGFRAEIFNSPNFVSFSAEQNGDELRMGYLQQSRGASLKMPVRLRLESNARFSSVLFEPQYFLSQIRFLDAEQTHREVSDFGTRHTIGMRSVLNIGIRQYMRDVQPNSGLVLFGEGRYGLNSDEIQIRDRQVNITANLTQRKGVRVGVVGYVAPLAKWNQSLRMMLQVYDQTDIPVFNVFSNISELFSELRLPGGNRTGILDTRYTIPLTYPDQGGLLLPAYLSNIYLVLFSQTVADMNHEDLIEGSRSVYGLGVRSRFRLSNLAFDVGVSIGWEPTRNQFTGMFGTF